MNKTYYNNIVYFYPSLSLCWLVVCHLLLHLYFIVEEMHSFVIHFEDLVVNPSITVFGAII